MSKKMAAMIMVVALTFLVAILNNGCATYPTDGAIRGNSEEYFQISGDEPKSGSIVRAFGTIDITREGRPFQYTLVWAYEKNDGTCSEPHMAVATGDYFPGLSETGTGRYAVTKRSGVTYLEELK